MLAHRERGVREVGAGDEAEGKDVGDDGFFATEEGFGNGGDELLVGLGDVGDGELVEAPALGVVARLALIETHLIFLLVETGEKLAEEKENQAGVDELDAGFFPSEDEALRVGDDEVDEEETADEVAAGENGERKVLNLMKHDEAFEPFFLHRPDAEMHLIEGGEEDQRGR